MPAILLFQSSDETVPYIHMYTYTIRKLDILIAMFGRLVNEAVLNSTTLILAASN